MNCVTQVVEEEIVTGSWDGTAKVWNALTQEVKWVLEGHSHATSAIAFPNGIVITGSQDKALRVWFQGKL